MLLQLRLLDSLVTVLALEVHHGDARRGRRRPRSACPAPDRRPNSTAQMAASSSRNYISAHPQGCTWTYPHTFTFTHKGTCESTLHTEATWCKHKSTRTHVYTDASMYVSGWPDLRVYTYASVGGSLDMAGFGAPRTDQPYQGKLVRKNRRSGQNLLPSAWCASVDLAMAIPDLLGCKVSGLEGGLHPPEWSTRWFDSATT